LRINCKGSLIYAKCSYPVKKNIIYHGILLRVDKSGINLVSPTAVRPDPSAGPSIREENPIAANAKPTPFLTTTSLKRFLGTP